MASQPSDPGLPTTGGQRADDAGSTQPHRQRPSRSVSLESLQDYLTTQNADLTHAGLQRAAALQLQPISSNVASPPTSSTTLDALARMTPLSHRRKARIPVQAVRDFLATNPNLLKEGPSGVSPASVCDYLHPTPLPGWQTREPARPSTSAGLDEQTDTRKRALDA